MTDVIFLIAITALCAGALVGIPAVGMMMYEMGTDNFSDRREWWINRLVAASLGLLATALAICLVMIPLSLAGVA